MTTRATPRTPWSRERAGLQALAISVDEHGTRVDELRHAGADAVVLTPAHQHPTGVVLTGERRAALLSWLRDSDAIAIEDDYDAEYRYDRAAIGAIQGLDPDRVVYAGSASKTLAPALRLGWLVVPPRLVAAVSEEKILADRGTARIEQHAFADFLTRGELDRHLRRMRVRYLERGRARWRSPGFRTCRARCGSRPHVQCNYRAATAKSDSPRGSSAARCARDESEYRPDRRDGPPVLLLGYAQMPASSIRAGIRQLADARRGRWFRR